MDWKQLVFARKYGLEIACVCWKIWAGNNLYLMEKNGLETTCICWKIWIGNSLSLLENMSWKQLVFAGKYGLENNLCVACHCWIWTDMQNCICHFWV